MEAPNRLQPAPLSTIEARNICIIKPSSLGDVVQALPILHALRTRFVNARITWVVNSNLAELLRPISMIDEVMAFDRESMRGLKRSTLFGFAGFLGTLRSKRFDLVMDLQGLLRSGLMCAATTAPHRIGLTSSREMSGWCYSMVVDDLPKAQNAVLRYWKVAELLGVGATEKQFPLELSADEMAWAASQMANAGGTLVGVNPGARWATKRWPAERFAESVNRVWNRSNATAVIVGSPGERAIADEVERQLAISAINLCGQTNLRQLAAVLDRCDLLLTNDSGPMHLAAALGTPTVSVFTCTSPERASPFGDGHRHAATNVWCKASYKKTCDRMDCFKDLPATAIVPLFTAKSTECDRVNAAAA